MNNLLKWIRNLFLKDYITGLEVADLLGCNYSTIFYWTNKVKLVKHCIGKRAYYKRSEVESRFIKIGKGEVHERVL